MSNRSSCKRDGCSFAASLLLGAACLVTSTRAAGDAADSKGRQACFGASEQAQLLTQAGKLRAARRELLVCSGEQCPSQMRRDCAKWLGDVEAMLPTVVFEAHDSAGNEETEVSVTVEGEKLVSRLDGKPVEVDPGDWTFVFTGADGRRADKKAVIHAGARAVRLGAVFDGAGGSGAIAIDSAQRPGSARGPSIPAGTFVLGGIALVAGSVGAYFALSGLNRENEQRESCAPRCADADVDSLRSRYLAADILFVAAGASTAGAAVWALLAARNATSSKSGSAIAPAVDLRSIGVTGVF